MRINVPHSRLYVLEIWLKTAGSRNQVLEYYKEFTVWQLGLWLTDYNTYRVHEFQRRALRFIVYKIDPPKVITYYICRSVTDRQRKYIWLINLIDDDAYFSVGQVYMMYLTKIKNKYWNQWRILILILTFYDTLFNIK